MRVYVCVCVSGLLANVDGHCHLGAASGCWWTEVAFMPTAVTWARKGIVNSVTVGVEVMWSSLVEGQTKQGCIACSLKFTPQVQ